MMRDCAVNIVAWLETAEMNIGFVRNAKKEDRPHVEFATAVKSVMMSTSKPGTP